MNDENRLEILQRDIERERLAEQEAMSEEVKEGPYKNQKCIHCDSFEQNHDDTKCQRRYPTLTDGTYVYMDSLRNVMGVGKQFDPEIEPFRCQVIDVPSIMRSGGYEQGWHSRDAEVKELRDNLKLFYDFSKDVCYEYDPENMLWNQG